jgi:hypothetical protein
MHQRGIYGNLYWPLLPAILRFSGFFGENPNFIPRYVPHDIGITG